MKTVEAHSKNARGKVKVFGPFYGESLREAVENASLSVAGKSMNEIDMSVNAKITFHEIGFIPDTSRKFIPRNNGNDFVFRGKRDRSQNFRKSHRFSNDTNSEMAYM